MYIYRKFTEGDEEALASLLRTQFPLFLKEDYWDWKYKKNPYFKPSLLAMAENDGKIIGCNHWLPRNLKFSKKSEIRTVLAGDLLVHRSHRGKGIASELLRFLRSSEEIKNSDVALSYMFGPIKLNEKIYAPVAGYVPAPNSTTTYKKFFSCRDLKEAIILLDGRLKSNERVIRMLNGHDLCVAFKLIGIPAFKLNITSQGINLTETQDGKPDLIIEGNLPLSSGIIDGKISTRSLIKAWITGKVRIRGRITKIFAFRKVFSILQKS